MLDLKGKFLVATKALCSDGLVPIDLSIAIIIVNCNRENNYHNCFGYIKNV